MSKTMKPGESVSTKLWLEWLNQQATPSTPKTIRSSREISKSTHSIKYKAPEEYHDEVLFLKKSIVTLKGENDYLKSKLRQIEEELDKKDKELTDFIHSIENQKTPKDSTVNSNITIMKLKQNIAQLKSSLKTKEGEILDLKSDIKYTKLYENKIQTEIYQQEIRSLQQLVKNFQLSQKESVFDQFKSAVPKEIPTPRTKTSVKTTNKNKALLKENKDLLAENNHLRLENEKYIKEKFSQIEKESVKTEKPKDTEKLNTEIERLKTICKELTQDKNNIASKHEELREKYKQLKERPPSGSQNMKDTRSREESIQPRKSRSVSIKPSMSPQGDGDSEISEQTKILESAVYSYLSRNKTISFKEPLIDPKTEGNVVVSSVDGYLMRQDILANKFEFLKSEREVSKFASNPIHSAIVGYLNRSRFVES